MIPQGRTSTSVWQIHSLGDLNSFLGLLLPLHYSPTPCDSHWFRRQLDRCWDRQSLSSASQNSWWAMSQCLSCTKSVWCCWLQQARLTDPSWGPGRTHWVSLFTRGKLWKMQTPEVTLLYTGEATHIPQIFTQPLKEIGWFFPIVSFLWYIFLGLQICEQYFLQEYLCLSWWFFELTWFGSLQPGNCL